VASLRPGKSYTTEEELFQAVRKEASIRAKVDRGDLTPHGSGDPPGDWRLYFAMSGEVSRAAPTRPGGAVSSYERNRGSGWLPGSPTREQQTTAQGQGSAGAAAPDLGAPVAQARDETPCVHMENVVWTFAADSFEEPSFMECPYGRKLLGHLLEVHISEQFEPADAGVFSTLDLLGPRLVSDEEDDPIAPNRPRKMTRGRGGRVRAADGWISGFVTGWHDARTNTVVAWNNQGNVPMQGPAKTNSRGRPACYLVYHAWLGCSLWHNLDLRLYSLDPADEVDHWRAFKRSEV